MTGFFIWSAVALVLVGIGIWDWNSKTPVGFYSGIKPTKVTDVRRYNHSVAIMWFVYAFVFELLGLPLEFIDERLTTVSAQRVLLQADLSRQKRREVVDKVAAAYILQTWLDRKNRSDI